MEKRPGLYERMKRVVLGSPRPVHWCRAVMEEETARLVRAIHPEQLDALEISGDKCPTTRCECERISTASWRSARGFTR